MTLTEVRRQTVTSLKYFPLLHLSQRDRKRTSITKAQKIFSRKIRNNFMLPFLQYFNLYKYANKD